MAYIQVHQSLGHHRKTLRMAARLKCDHHKLLGHLIDLWWWGLDNASPQGLLGRVAPEELAIAAGWATKDAGRFVEALLECGGDGQPGFLERSALGYMLHDWPDYAGKLNDQRALRRESNRRAQSARRQRLQTADVSADSQRSQHPTGPDLTGPDLTGPDTLPSPSHDVSADALETNGAAAPNPRKTGTRRSKPHANGTPVPACCPNFARTGQHWEHCPEAQTA
jgi:hypothetical protein